jgi:hypothetical protein
MTRLMRAEALRLATTRTYWLLAAVLIAGAIAATAAATRFNPRYQPGPLCPGHRRAGPDRRAAGPARSRSPASSGIRPSLPLS